MALLPAAGTGRPCWHHWLCCPWERDVAAFAGTLGKNSSLSLLLGSLTFASQASAGASDILRFWSYVRALAAGATSKQLPGKGGKLGHHRHSSAGGSPPQEPEGSDGGQPIHMEYPVLGSLQGPFKANNPCVYQQNQKGYGPHPAPASH